MLDWEQSFTLVAQKLLMADAPGRKRPTAGFALLGSDAFHAAPIANSQHGLAQELRELFDGIELPHLLAFKQSEEKALYFFKPFF
jgi:hypothetical protein